MDWKPSEYELSGPPPPSPWKWFFPLLALVAAFIGVTYWLHRRGQAAAETPPAARPETARDPEQAKAPPEYWTPLVWPTVRTNLLDAPAEESFQDTGTGNPESGRYGSVRTGSSGLAQFHEGIDVRSATRDRSGQPLDEVRAIAAGRVAYASRVAGNSNYGKYVVLLHPDAIGEVFTLYAHLADVAAGIRSGAPIAAGGSIGRMGNTSSSGLPMVRAHLHLEAGLVLNMRFAEWGRARGLKPDHGNWHGWNLLGIDPLSLFRYAREHGRLDFGGLLKATPAAFTIAVRAGQTPEFFRRHTALWEGAPFDGGALAVTATENGLPLAGRNLTAEERTALGRAAAIVLAADAGVLGRNGRRLVQQKAGRWIPGSNAEEWLEILLYPERVR